MKDINKIYAECKEMVESAGYVIWLDPILKVNTRAKNRWGCVKTRGLTQVLEISSRLLADDIPDYPAYNTMLHEILHIVAGPNEGHGPKWKTMASTISAMYGYNIKRASNYDEYIGVDAMIKAYKWRATCKKCGKVFYRQRVSQYDTYSHTGCGGRLTPWELNIETPKVETKETETPAEKRKRIVIVNGVTYEVEV